MYTKRCPLCYVRTRYEAIEHLTRDHRRSYAEACARVESRKEGNPGPEMRGMLGRKGHSSLASSANVAPLRANTTTSRSLWLPVPPPFGHFRFR